MKSIFQNRWSELFPNLPDAVTIFDLDRIERFHLFLVRENEKGGFFSKNDTSVILDRHLIECALFAFKLSTLGYVSRETKLADVGTGPGLPGFLFSCLLNSPSLTLIDSQRRKLSLLEGSELADGIEFVYSRVEDCPLHFSVVTCRAMVPYPWSLEVVTPILKIGSLFCPFLGNPLNLDSKERQKANSLGFELKEILPLPELEFLGKRHIRVLEKKHKEEKGFPRPWKTILKEMQS